MNNTAIAVAWTGASGIHYGIRLLEELRRFVAEVGQVGGRCNR